MNLRQSHQTSLYIPIYYMFCRHLFHWIWISDWTIHPKWPHNWCLIKVFWPGLTSIKYIIPKKREEHTTWQSGRCGIINIWQLFCWDIWWNYYPFTISLVKTNKPSMFGNLLFNRHLKISSIVSLNHQKCQHLQSNSTTNSSNQTGMGERKNYT